MAIEQEKAKRQNKQTSKGIIKHSKDKREKIAVDNSTGTGIIKKDDSYLASFPELNINPILEVDNEGNLIYQNPACQRIFPDISTLCLKHPLFRDWHKVLRELQNAHPRQPVIRDISVGDSFYEQAYFAINNNRVRIYGRDITKRKKAEQSLKIAEENLRKSNEESPLGIRIVSKDGKTVFANHAVLDMFSYKNVEEFNTIPTEKSYNPESYTNSGMRLERQRRGESVPDSWEVNLGHKDGKVHHLQVFRSEVLWEGQLHDQRLYLDITDHKNAEQALQTTEENFRNSIENSPIGIRIVADDGETLYINQALLSMYGYKNLEEFKATPARSRYTPKSYLEFNERREKRLREEPLPNDYEVSIICKDGTVRHLQVFRKAVLWGGKRQYQALYMDITERKQMITRINDLNDILQLVTNINQLIVEIDNESELLQRACEQFIASRHYKLAWIGLIQKSSYDILPTAQAISGGDYLSSMRITWDDSPYGNGPAGIAIKTGKPCVIRDILHDRRFAPWRDKALNRGFKSVVALPLVVQKK